MKPIKIWDLVNIAYEIAQVLIGGTLALGSIIYMFDNKQFDNFSLSLVFLGMGCFSWTLASETFGRKFDKYFADKLAVDSEFCFRMAITMRLPPNIVGKFRLVRTIIYGREITLRRNLKKKSNMDSRWFGDFDFRKNATWFEIAIAYITITSAFLMVLSALWPTIQGLLQHF